MKKILSLIFVTTLTQCAEQADIPLTPEADNVETINESDHPLIAIINRFAENNKRVNPVYYADIEKKFPPENKLTDEEKELICSNSNSLNILLTKQVGAATQHKPILSDIIYFSQFIEDITFLLQQGANPNILIYSHCPLEKRHEKESILYRLTSVGRACKESLTLDLIKLLLKNGANPNLGSYNKDSSRSPLFLPLIKKEKEKIVILKNYNADPEPAARSVVETVMKLFPGSIKEEEKEKKIQDQIEYINSIEI